jgi:predicted NAD/FAD-dependent oxidoreductase
MLIGIVGGGCSGTECCHAVEMHGQCVDVSHPDE